MASTIPVAFVNSYRSNVTMLYQQKASVLRDVGRVEAPTGEAHFFERLAPHDMLQRTARHSEQDVQDADHTRRMVIMNEWYTNQYIDKEDKLRMLIDPQGPYTMNASAAAGRKIDSVVYSAIRGNAYSGHAGATPVALPSGQKIAHGGAGLTKAKVLEAHRKLTFSEVPQDGRYFIYNAFGLEDLLNVTEVTSADYSGVKALTTGELGAFMGFKWIVYNFAAESSVYYSVACHRDAVGIVIPMEPTIEIDRLPTKHYLTQVYLELSLGATRILEEGVVEIAYQ